MRLHIEALRLAFRMWRWKAGVVPSFGERRTILEFLEQLDDARSRGTMDMLAGPAFLSKISDKQRRRRMAVYRIKSAMSIDEKLDAAIRMAERLIKSLEKS